MNTFAKKIQYFSFAILLFLSCNKKNKESKPTGANSQNPIEVHNNYYLDSNESYIIRVNYPSDSRDKDSLIANLVMSNVRVYQEEWKIGGEEYLYSKELKLEHPDYSYLPYEYGVNYTTVKSTKLGYTTYKCIEYDYTGGAHPNSYAINFTFDDNKYVRLAQVLDTSYSNMLALSNMLAYELVAQNGDRINEEFMQEGLGLKYLRTDGTFDKEEALDKDFTFASNFEVFTIQDVGIVFTMQQYQVAPYSSGMPEALLPWTVLKPYLNKEFIKRNNL